MEIIKPLLSQSGSVCTIQIGI